MWVECSKSAACTPSCSTADTCSLERLTCSDDCVETKLMQQRQEEMQMRSSEQLAILANTGVINQACLTPLLLITVLIMYQVL